MATRGKNIRQYVDTVKTKLVGQETSTSSTPKINNTERQTWPPATTAETCQQPAYKFKAIVRSAVCGLQNMLVHSQPQCRVASI